jgi:hypothetical protein
MTNTITFDFDYNHNIFETLTPYYPHIINIPEILPLPSPSLFSKFSTDSKPKITSNFRK